MPHRDLPNSYSEAVESKSKWYFTGAPCPRGHISPRFVSTRACKECCKENAMRSHVHITDRRWSVIDLATFKEKATEVHAGWYSYDRFEYIDAHTPSTITCPLHGDFKMSTTNHTRKRGCKMCWGIRSGNEQRKTLDAFLEEAKKLWGEAFDYAGADYKGARSLLHFKCAIHNKEVSQTPNNHLGGQNPCSMCNHKKSKQQEQIAAYIESLGLVVKQNVTDKSVLGKYEADIWVPEIKLAIEHHGLYYHKGAGSKHRDKWEEAEKNGIRLVQVFEDEWSNKQSIIKSRLAAIAGKATRTFARKLRLEKISNVEAKAFLEVTHLQGHGKCTVAYGLFDSAKLVAVATFCKARSGAMTVSGTDGWEVLRYASVGCVVGGFGRLLSAFEKDYMPKLLVSYCDLRYGMGEVYNKTGFKLESITQPDYWWVGKNGGKRLPRYQTQKHKLKVHPVFSTHYHDSRTENEICTAAGYEKLHGVGNQKWVRTYP